MSDFRKRLFIELGDLNSKIDKLQDFILGKIYDSLDEIDRKDLKEQLEHMKNYQSVLSRRVSRLCNDA